MEKTAAFVAGFENAIAEAMEKMAIAPGVSKGALRAIAGLSGGISGIIPGAAIGAATGAAASEKGERGKGALRGALAGGALGAAGGAVGGAAMSKKQLHVIKRNIQLAGAGAHRAAEGGMKGPNLGVALKNLDNVTKASKGITRKIRGGYAAGGVAGGLSGSSKKKD